MVYPKNDIINTHTQLKVNRVKLLIDENYQKRKLSIKQEKILTDSWFRLVLFSGLLYLVPLNQEDLEVLDAFWIE